MTTHCLTGYEPNWTNSQFVVAWGYSKLPSIASWLWTDFVNPSLEKYTTLHRGSDRSELPEYIGWEQGRHTLNFQQAGLERAAEE